MNRKLLKNIRFYNKIFKVLVTRKSLQLIIANQLLIVSTPILIVSAHNNISEETSTEAKIVEISRGMEELSSNVSDVISVSLASTEKDNYVSNVAEFYGVEDNVIEDVIVDITEKEPEKIILSSNPEAIIIEESQNKINRENIQVEQNAFFTFADASHDKINEVKNSEIGAIYEKYGKAYGVDPDLLMARDMQESGLEHNSFNPAGAYGISQIEHTLFYDPVSNPNAGHVHVFNYETNSYEDFTITEQGALEIDTNIKYGAAKMQEKLRSYDYNIFLALQSYNYGSSMNTVINNYSIATGKSYDDIIADANDFGWLEYVSEFHNNPNQYIDWPYGLYGDDLYISHIMRYISDEVITVKDEQGNDIIFNLKTAKSLNSNDTKLEKYVENVKTKSK